MSNVKFDLVNNQNEREIIINEERLDVLDKVKELVFMKGTEYMTTKQVADYYERPIETIATVVKRNKEELIKNGYINVKRKDLNNIFGSEWTFKTCRGKTELSNNDLIINVTNTGLNLFNKRSILNIGMLLEDSPVAEEVRTLLDNHEQLNNIHKKLDNGEEITKEDIDKSNPLYFVNREKELRKQEKDLNISLAEAINTGDMNKYMAIDCQKNKIKEDLIALEKERNELNKSKVEGYDVFINTDNLLSWDTVAKNLGIGRNTLLKILREHKILQTDKYKYNGRTYAGEHHNVPYKLYMKYFEVKFTTTLNNKRTATTKVTADGQAYILKKLKEWKLIA